MPTDMKHPLNTRVRKPCRLAVRLPRITLQEIRGMYLVADNGQSEEFSKRTSPEEEKRENER